MPNQPDATQVGEQNTGLLPHRLLFADPERSNVRSGRSLRRLRRAAGTCPLEREETGRGKSLGEKLLAASLDEEPRADPVLVLGQRQNHPAATAG